MAINLKVLNKLWQLIGKDHRGSLVAVLVMMLIGMVLETLSVSVVIPAIALITQNDIANQYPQLIPLLSLINNPSSKELVFFGMISLIGIYAIKVLFLGFLSWRQMKFVHEIQAELSYRLFSGYLRQPYVFHLQRNSAQLINTAVTETSLFTHSVLIAGMTVITESLVMIGILILLIVVEPAGALFVMSTLSIAALFFSRMTKNFLLSWGKARQKHEELRIQHLQQGLGGAKDVKLLGREKEFLDQYQFHNDESAKIGWKQKTLAQFPRLWLELLAVSGIATLVMVMLSQGKQLESILPTMGLFAAAAFRIMPSVNRILIAIQSLRFSLPVIDILHRETQLIQNTLPPTDSKKINFEHNLILKHVCFQYPNTEKQVVNDICIEITCGSSVGFIGGSGAGKSTLVDLILGLLTPGRGVVEVDGIDIQKNLRNWQDHIGYVPQTIFLTDDTLRRNIAFGLTENQINEDAVLHAVAAAQLEQFVSEQADGLDTLVGERGVRLSGGQRQRIGIARALYHDPQVLVLDEATSSLDIDTENGIMESVRALQGSKTILIVAHRLSTVEHCNILFRLDQGVLVEQGDSSVVLAGTQTKV
jgi:ABC-type multidrug transport system fused ATPase/permease subunit